MVTVKEFKDIQVRDQHIKVSSDGSEVYRNGKLARQNTNSDGYLVVSINNRAIGVHRLVAIAFLPNNDAENLEVNHIDFNRKNNNVSNLEWLTHTENIKHSAKNGRYKNKCGKDNPNYGNTKLSEFYKNNPEISLEKQSRKGKINGRATPIDLYKDDELIQSFEYIGECCEYLHINYNFSHDAEIVRCGIRRSINRGVPYKGFTFKKH